MTITIAQPNDVNTIHQYIQTLENASLDFNSFKDIFLINLTQPNIIYLVAKINNQVVGFVSAHGQLLLHHVGYVYEIQELFVEEAYRKQGIANALVNYLFRQVQNRQATTLEVTANMLRQEAHAFYTKHGFMHTHFKFVKDVV